jgi:hypothetical protein
MFFSAIAFLLVAVQSFVGKSPFAKSSSTGAHEDATTLPLVSPSSAEIFLGQVALHSTTPLEFQLTNRSDGVLKVVGTPGVCVRQGCISAVVPPQRIEARQTATFRYSYQADEVGLVNLQTQILLDVGNKNGLAVDVKLLGSVVKQDASP